MIKLYEYIKMKLFYLGAFEHPLVAQLFYIIAPTSNGFQIYRLKSKNYGRKKRYSEPISFS